MHPPTTMRAVVLTGHGGLDKLEYREDWPTPKPGPDEVIIQVRACGLNNTDINTRAAWYSKTVTEAIGAGGTSGFAEADSNHGSWSTNPLTFPRIQGADTVGYIVSTGHRVAPSRLGERVIVNPWILNSNDWLNPINARYFGSEIDGGFAEYSCIRSCNAIKIDTELSDTELATFPCAMTTAENLIARTKLKAGETVIITGASGGVGTAAIQLCRLRRAKIIAIASSEKAPLLTKLGADIVIDRNDPNLQNAILTAASGPVEVALDVVGGDIFMPLLNSLRHGGRYSSSGAIAGPTVNFDLRQLIYKDLQLTGATIVRPHIFNRLVKLIEDGQLKPTLAKQFPLRELALAQETFMAKKHVGNIVVTIPG